MKNSLDWSSFMAENFTQKDIIVAAIGYRVAPEGKSLIFQYLNQNKEAN